MKDETNELRVDEGLPAIRTTDALAVKQRALPPTERDEGRVPQIFTPKREVETVGI